MLIDTVCLANGVWYARAQCAAQRLTDKTLALTDKRLSWNNNIRVAKKVTFTPGGRQATFEMGRVRTRKE